MAAVHASQLSNNGPCDVGCGKSVAIEQAVDVNISDDRAFCTRTIALWRLRTTPIITRPWKLRKIPSPKKKYHNNGIRSPQPVFRTGRVCGYDRAAERSSKGPYSKTHAGSVGACLRVDAKGWCGLWNIVWPRRMGTLSKTFGGKLFSSGGV
jgi:hypothetical protein